MSYQTECPYCQHIHRIELEDYSEDLIHETECPKCEKLFVYTVSILISIYSKSANCLNTGKHIFEPTTTGPKCYTKMRCFTCGTERLPNAQEIERYSIPTFDEEHKNLMFKYWKAYFSKM